MAANFTSFDKRGGKRIGTTAPRLCGTVRKRPPLSQTVRERVPDDEIAVESAIRTKNDRGPD